MTARTISAGQTRLNEAPRTTVVVQASGVSQLERHGTPPAPQPGAPRAFTSPNRGQRPPNGPLTRRYARAQDHFRVLGGGFDAALRDSRMNHQTWTALHTTTPATMPQPRA